MVTPIVNDESKPLMKKLYDNGFRYIYEDGDGTAHYFREKDGSTSEFEDEEGMGLTLKKNSDNTYEISSDTGGKMTFTSAGYLSKVYNTNGKNYEVCYDGVKIQSILDGAGRRITVTSDRDGQITSMTDPSNRVTSFDYTNSGALELITYPDGKWTKFSYDSNKRMSWAWGTDRRWVQYEYPSSGSEAVMNRVTRVTEYGSDDSVGNWLSMDYSAMNQTKFTDNRGRTEVYQFDNMGRTVSIRDADGGYQSYKYVFGGEKNNKTANALKSANVGEHFVCNLLKNHSFEQSDSNWTFTPNGDDSSGNVWVYSADSIPTENTYLGRKSACLSNGAQITQKTSVPSSKVYYSLSAYVKTDSSAANATLSIEFMNSSNSVIKTATSNPVNYTTDWQRICISAGAPENTAKIRVCCKANGTGTAWFDCVQLEQGDGASAYNLVEDSGFQASSGLWSATGSQGSNEGIQGDTNKYYRIAGSASQEKQVRQQIYIGRSASTTFFSISGRAWADSVPVNDKEERYFGLGLCAHFTDGTEDVKRVSFNAAYSADWQYASDTIGFSGDKTIEYVYAFFSYGKNANAVYFDDLQVNLDAAGTTYSYDKEGNLISAKDNAGRHQTFNYNSANELTKIKTADNKNYTYEYDSTNKHQLNSATSLSSGIKISLEYDQFGNVTSSTARHVSGGGKFIKQETQYTADGNYMASSQNDRGSTTTYDYNSLKGTLNSVTDPNQSTTYYTYDPNNDRLLSVSDQSNASSGSATTVGYGYNGERLQTITTPSTQYGFTYDTYGNSETVSAGNQTLVTNTYNDQNGTLRSRAYGNGGTVSYSYDFLDRPAYQKYNDVTRYSWGYNAAGQLAGFWDYVSGKTYTYTYDLLGRMERMDVSDGSWIVCAYNNIDQSTGLRYRYGGVTQNIGYAYSDRDNLPLSTTFSDYGTVTNEYDTLTRLTHRNYTLAGSGTLRTSYDYLDWTTDANRTTGTVDGICYTYSPGGLTLPDLAYSYDANGNITEVRGGSALDPDTLRQHLKNGTAIPQSMSGQENYTYDAKGQLIRHDSATQNASFTYSYDKAGNITAVSKYAYTTGTLGTALETKNYTYATGTWGDLLTNYNGKAISYDAIGNMTSYDGATFTWEGRSLASLSKGGSSYSYRYNADGIRTGKTVNGTVTEYFLSGSQILAQKTGNSVIWFFYDSQGTRTGLLCGGHFYYYLYNVQGDVVALADSANGQIVARYDYDAWGKCTVTNANGSTVGDDNPFRYRGYYYDADTGLYYLNSRYYDPELRRFISSDTPAVATASPGNANWDKNLFAYCDNNPVTRKDDGGQCWHLIVGAAVGVLSQYVGDVLTNLSEGKSLSESLTTRRSTWADYASAAISGALAATGIGAGASVLANAALGGTTYLVNCAITGEDPNALDMVLSTGAGALSGYIGGKGVNGKRLRGVVKYSKNMIKTGAAPAKAAMYAAKIPAAFKTAAKGARKTFFAGLSAYAVNLGRRFLTGSEA